MCIVFQISVFVCLSLLLTVPAGAQTQAYIPSYDDNSVKQIPTATPTFTSVALGDGPYGAAVMPDGSYVLITRIDGNVVTAIPSDDFENTGAQVAIAVGNAPRGVAVESGGLYAYVANYDDDTVSEISLATFAVTDTLEVGDGPWGVAATYDEADAMIKVYVANHLADSISEITDSGITTISSVGDGPLGLALTPDGRYLYVANYNADTVAIIRTSDRTIVRTLTVDDGPWGVAVGSEGAYAYVTNSESDLVTVIRTSNQTVLRTFNVGNQPMGVAAAKNGDFAYVVNQQDSANSLSRINVVNETVESVGSDELFGAFALGAFIGGTPPTRPSGLSIKVESYSRISLTWTDNASDELGFKIERRKDTDDLYTQITKVGANITTYTDSGLEDNTTYFYRIRAYNEAADSEYTAATSDTTEEGSFSWCFIGSILK